MLNEVNAILTELNNLLEHVEDNDKKIVFRKLFLLKFEYYKIRVDVNLEKNKMNIYYMGKKKEFNANLENWKIFFEAFLKTYTGNDLVLESIKLGKKGILLFNIIREVSET